MLGLENHLNVSFRVRGIVRVRVVVRAGLFHRTEFLLNLRGSCMQ